ncbi:hypothetical protein DP124_08595 [Clostridium tetani]|nr:hypothetical protein DP124_08595 [Clostridium tetani]RXI52867.1 hypothetical protein DP122_09085 [Clostridium tetani]RXM69929.1 hypothetical protein DP139_07805 [Clostridium tetani]RXM72918.1 hypothetical protein DP143_07595 [Clostridium tetani]BDR63660.1 hypothetical protein K134307016_05940 [Clostridium tetani]
MGIKGYIKFFNCCYNTLYSHGLAWNIRFFYLYKNYYINYIRRGYIRADVEYVYVYVRQDKLFLIKEGVEYV